jgi:hypothetical protein
MFLIAKFHQILTSFYLGLNICPEEETTKEIGSKGKQKIV